MGRSRGSSVVPGAAVNPKRARVSMTMPPVVAACFCPLAHPGLPPFADLVGEPFREVAAGLLELSGEVALDGALGDAEQVGCGLGALGLLDQVLHLLLGRLRQGAGEVRGVGLVEAVGEDAHQCLLPFVLAGDDAGLDVPGDVHIRAVFLEQALGPQHALGALVLDHPG